MSENVYDKARAVLKERGWQQGSPGNTGPVCILGACAVAAGQSAYYDWTSLHESRPDITSTIVSVILEQFPEHDSGRSEFTPWRFNDAEGRTLADVDLVLDKAARIHDEQAS